MNPPDFPPMGSDAFDSQLTPYTLSAAAVRVSAFREDWGETLSEYADTFAEIRELPVYIAGASYAD